MGHKVVAANGVQGPFPGFVPSVCFAIPSANAGDASMRVPFIRRVLDRPTATARETRAVSDGRSSCCWRGG